MHASTQPASRRAGAEICQQGSKAKAALAEGVWLATEHATEGKACSDICSTRQKLAEGASFAQDARRQQRQLQLIG